MRFKSANSLFCLPLGWIHYERPGPAHPEDDIHYALESFPPFCEGLVDLDSLLSNILFIGSLSSLLRKRGIANSFA